MDRRAQKVAPILSLYFYAPIRWGVFFIRTRKAKGLVMKILVLSDLHNEINPIVPLQLDVDVVILAGDINEGGEGIRWAREVWRDNEIIYVLGNHEYFGGIFCHRLAAMRNIAKKLGVHLLEMDEVELGGIRFLGCTLWTDFDLFGEEIRREVMRISEREMPDYRMIDYDDTWRISPSVLRDRHLKSVEWLRNKLQRKKVSNKTIVVTHHSPTRNSVTPEYATNLLSASFASDLSELMGCCDIWVHGHMHESFDYVQAGTRVLCNPRGCSWVGGAAKNTGFLLDKVIDI